jgi:hypothetical protein
VAARQALPDELAPPERARRASPESRLEEVSGGRALLRAEAPGVRERLPVEAQDAPVRQRAAARAGLPAERRASVALPLAARPSALPFRDPVQVALARQRWKQSAHAIQRLRTASPRARSWQAARDEVLS